MPTPNHTETLEWLRGRRAIYASAFDLSSEDIEIAIYLDVMIETLEEHGQHVDYGDRGYCHSCGPNRGWPCPTATRILTAVERMKDGD